jgi:hypothetical protein
LFSPWYSWNNWWVGAKDDSLTHSDKGRKTFISITTHHNNIKLLIVVSFVYHAFVCFVNHFITNYQK